MNDERALNILLIEDNEIIGDALRDHAASYGWTVDWVADLHSSLLAIESTDYGLVLLDLHLPDGSGLDVLRELRKRIEIIPVIILSAYDQLSDRMQGLKLGAIDYLVKPFDLSEMVARIELLFRDGHIQTANHKCGQKLRTA